MLREKENMEEENKKTREWEKRIKECDKRINNRRTWNKIIRKENRRAKDQENERMKDYKTVTEQGEREWKKRINK